MPDTELAPLIACINSSEDIVQLLADVMRQEGFRAVTHAAPVRWAADEAVTFFTDLQPDGCIFSVSIPYEDSWAEFLAVHAAMPQIAFVVTTTNKRALDELVGPTDSIEIIGKPFDLDEVCEAVRRALADQRRTRP